jgi:hypothetical protein
MYMLSDGEYECCCRGPVLVQFVSLARNSACAVLEDMLLLYY